jgi:hypothetical protein
MPYILTEEALLQYPVIAPVARLLTSKERETNVPVPAVYVSFDARDELIRYSQEQRVFFNSVEGPMGERGVTFNGTILIPSNQLQGSDVWVKISAER